MGQVTLGCYAFQVLPRTSVLLEQEAAAKGVPSEEYSMHEELAEDSPKTQVEPGSLEVQVTRVQAP